MNLSLAQFPVTADTPSPVPGGGKPADQAPGGLGLSFPSLLSTETKDLDGIQVPLAMFMPAMAEEPSAAPATGAHVQGGEGKNPLKEGQQGELALPVHSRPALTPGQQENLLITADVKESLAGEQQPTSGSMPPEQGSAVAALQGRLLQEPLAQLGDRTARLPAGQNLYQQLDTPEAEEAGKWMYAHRHLVLRSVEAGAGTTVRIQPLPGTQGTNPSDPNSAPETTKPQPVSISEEKLGPVPPLAQPAGDVTYPASRTENLTGPLRLKTDQHQENQIQPGKAETLTAASPEVSREMASAGNEATPALVRHLHQNMTVHNSGLPPLPDSLTAEGKPLEILAGQTASPNEAGGPDLPGNIRTQVMNQVASRLEISPGGEKLTIKLEPEHLGKVEVQLTGEKDTLTIVLKASGQEAEQALQKGIKELTENILDRSQRWQNVEIRIDARETPEERSQGRSQENREQSKQPGQDGKRDQDGRGRDRRGSRDPEQATGG